MRGLVIFTLNSTYIFDDVSVMWMSNDNTKEYQTFGDVEMRSGVWYDLVLRPKEPQYDWLGIGGSDIKPITFTFKKRTFDGVQNVTITTSRLRNFLYTGDGDNTNVWRTDEDDYNAALALLLGKIDELGTCLYMGKPQFDRKLQAIKYVRDELGLPLVKARDLVTKIQDHCLAVEVKVNQTPLADWERNLIDSQY